MSAFCTQIDPRGSGRERCAGAVLASCLLSEGWQSDPWELTVQVSDTHGFTDRGATSDQLIEAGAQYGFEGAKWLTWGDAIAALDQGQDVLALLDNSYLHPRQYPALLAWNALHWIRIMGLLEDGELAYVYDPLCYQSEAGGRVWQGPGIYTVASIRQAIAATPLHEAGVLLWREP